MQTSSGAPRSRSRVLVSLYWTNWRPNGTACLFALSPDFARARRPGGNGIFLPGRRAFRALGWRRWWWCCWCCLGGLGRGVSRVQAAPDQQCRQQRQQSSLRRHTDLSMDLTLVWLFFPFVHWCMGQSGEFLTPRCLERLVINISILL